MAQEDSGKSSGIGSMLGTIGSGLLGGLGGGVLSGLFSSFYEPEEVDIGKIEEYQAPTQALLDLSLIHI